MGNSTGNGHSRVPLEILDRNYPEIIDLPPAADARAAPAGLAGNCFFLFDSADDAFGGGV